MSILAHYPARERDHVTSTSVALVVSSRPGVRYTAQDQRAELHLDRPDEVLVQLALRASAAGR